MNPSDAPDCWSAQMGEQELRWELQLCRSARARQGGQSWREHTQSILQLYILEQPGSRHTSNTGRAQPHPSGPSQTLDSILETSQGKQPASSTF